jgi:hypothetical protein
MLQLMGVTLQAAELGKAYHGLGIACHRGLGAFSMNTPRANV